MNPQNDNPQRGDEARDPGSLCYYYTKLLHQVTEPPRFGSRIEMPHLALPPATLVIARRGDSTFRLGYFTAVARVTRGEIDVAALVTQPVAILPQHGCTRPPPM